MNASIVVYNVRKEAGISQREFAKLIGISQSALSYLERGLHTDMRISTLKKLAKFLDMEPYELLEIIDL